MHTPVNSVMHHLRVPERLYKDEPGKGKLRSMKYHINEHYQEANIFADFVLRLWHNLVIHMESSSLHKVRFVFKSEDCSWLWDVYNRVLTDFFLFLMIAIIITILIFIFLYYYIIEEP